MGISYGEKYEKLDIKEIAKNVRKDIREAIKAGDIVDLKASVRIERFSGGQALNVSITEFSREFLNPRRVWTEELDKNWIAHPDLPPRYSAFAEVALETIKKIVAAYNYDGSDVQTDYFNVNFYSSVKFDWMLEKAEKTQILAGLNPFDSAERPENPVVQQPSGEPYLAAEDCLGDAQEGDPMPDTEQNPEALTEPENESEGEAVPFANHERGTVEISFETSVNGIAMTEDAAWDMIHALQDAIRELR